MNYIFDIENIAFRILNYPVSYVELVATLFGLLTVYYATKANILTWPAGIINEVFLFFLFFQVQLYADMVLQIFFFIVTVYGWYNWKKIIPDKKVYTLSTKDQLKFIIVILVGTALSAFLFSNIHLYFPKYFAVEASYPIIDSFVMVLSIAATILLAKKKIETWYLWILVDIICIFLFFKKEIYFLALEYFIFLGLATYGLLQWNKILKNG